MSGGRVLLGLALAVTAAGCGDPALWARWRVERARWAAEREIRRIELTPQLATARDFTRAAALLDRAATIAPLERWAAPGAPGDPAVAREVAVLTGRALIRRAELDLMRARRPEGITALESAFHRARALPEVARDAAHILASALDHLGRDDEALEWWRRLATDFAPYDPATGRPVEPVLEAARIASRRLEQRGRPEAGDSVLAGVERRFAAGLDATTVAPGERAWRALGGLRTLRGDPHGALHALRSALRGAATAEVRATLLLDLGRAALAAGWPDSARAYAAVPARMGGEARRHALRLEARAFEAAGAADSALATWARLIEEYPKAQDSAAEARHRRGAILEGLGRWEAARSEYRTLAAAHPSHPLAFESLLRIVQYHVARGEREIARLEAGRLVENMDYLIATQHDEGVQRAARRTRGEALLAVGDHARAFEALAEVWRRWPATPGGVEAAWKAAEVAAGPLADRAASDSLLAEIAGGALDPEDRVRARSRLGRPAR